MVRTAAAIASLALAAAAVAADGNPRDRLRASSHGKHVRATRGTYCSEQLCADFAYPLELHGRLPVHGGGVVRLRFGAAPSAVSAVLRDSSSHGLADVALSGSGRHYRAHLPAKLPRRMDRLGVSVSYKPGDADFEIGLKRHLHRR